MINISHPNALFLNVDDAALLVSENPDKISLDDTDDDDTEEEEVKDIGM